MKRLLIFIFFTFLLWSCNHNSIDDKEKRNENWCWWVDAKTNKGEWIPIKDETTVEKGKYTLFYSNGNLREKGKLNSGKRIDTIYVMT